jgi:hypothetical protein
LKEALDWWSVVRPEEGEELDQRLPQEEQYCEASLLYLVIIIV